MVNVDAVLSGLHIVLTICNGILLFVEYIWWSLLWFFTFPVRLISYFTDESTAALICCISIAIGLAIITLLCCCKMIKKMVYLCIVIVCIGVCGLTSTMLFYTSIATLQPLDTISSSSSSIL